MITFINYYNYAPFINDGHTDIRTDGPVLSTIICRDVASAQLTSKNVIATLILSNICLGWMKVGESVQIRPSNNSGVIAYMGRTEFAPGTWVGVELDTPQEFSNFTRLIFLKKLPFLNYKLKK